MAQTALGARIERAGIVRPMNWDELGSSAKDRWEERMLPTVEKIEAGSVMIGLTSIDDE